MLDWFNDKFLAGGLGAFFSSLGVFLASSALFTPLCSITLEASRLFLLESWLPLVIIKPSFAETLSRISITSDVVFGTGGGAVLGGDGACDFFFIFGGRGGDISSALGVIGEDISGMLSGFGEDISISTADRYNACPLLENRRTTRASLTSSDLKGRHGLYVIVFVAKV